LDPSGQVKDSILTGATTSGNIEFELTRHPFFITGLESVFRNTFGVGTKGDGIDPPTFGAVTADELVVGSVLKLFAIEKRFTDTSTSTNYYHMIRLCAFDTLSISIAPNQPITGSFGISGGPMALPVAEETGATYPSAGSYPVFTAPEVTMISLGAVPQTLCFNSLTLDFASNVRGIECIGTLGFREQTLGRFEASLTGAAYFVSNDILEALIDQDKFAVQVTMEDQDGNEYTFDYPVCKMTAGAVNAAGTGQDVIANVTIQALYDPNWGYTCKVTRVHVV
jgi:hypothetical protein